MLSLSLAIYRLLNLSKYPPGWRALARKTKAAHPFCSFCGVKENKLKGIVLQVHHRKPVHLFPDLAMDPDNLLVLCEWDHYREAHVSNYSKGWDPNIKDRAFENLTAIRIVQADEGVKN